MSVVTSLRALRQLFRVLAIVALTGVVAIVPVACGDDPAPNIGWVKDKKYEGADSDVVVNCEESNKDGFCIRPKIEPFPQGAHYRLLISDGNREGWVEVTPEQYNRIYVGDPWPERRTTSTTSTTSTTAVPPTTTAVTAPTDPAPRTP